MIWRHRIRLGYFINNLFNSLFDDLWASNDLFDDPLDRLCGGHHAGRSAVDIVFAVRLGVYSPNVKCFKVSCSLFPVPLCQRTIGRLKFALSLSQVRTSSLPQQQSWLLPPL